MKTKTNTTEQLELPFDGQAEPPASAGGGKDEEKRNGGDEVTAARDAVVDQLKTETNS